MKGRKNPKARRVQEGKNRKALPPITRSEPG